MACASQTSEKDNNRQYLPERVAYDTLKTGRELLIPSASKGGLEIGHFY